MKKLIAVMVIMFLFGCSSTPKRADDATVPVVTKVEDTGSGAGSAGDQSEVEAFKSKRITRSEKRPLDDSSELAHQLKTRIFYFDYDSSGIKPEDRDIIVAHVNHLLKNPDIFITLSGHADERGSREYNLALGEQRARSVQRQMSLLGVTGERIKILSYGEEKPAIDDHTEYAWSRNRRVEIIY